MSPDDVTDDVGRLTRVMRFPFVTENLIGFRAECGWAYIYSLHRYSILRK